MCFYIHQPYTGCNHGWKNVWSVCRQPDLCQPVEREPPEYVTRKLQPIRGMCRRCEQLGGPEPRERGRPSRPRPKEFEEPIAEPRLARRHHRDFDSDAFHAPEFEDGYPRERGRGPAMRLPQGQHDDFDAPANHNLHINNHLYGGGAAAHTEPNLVIREPRDLRRPREDPRLGHRIDIGESPHRGLHHGGGPGYGMRTGQLSGHHMGPPRVRTGKNRYVEVRNRPPQDHRRGGPTEVMLCSVQ